MKINTSLFLLLLAVGALQAQVPEGINYQCVIRNPAGVEVANKAVTIRFSVLPSINGNPVYVETQSDSTNQFGVLTAVIGHGTPQSGQFSAINWATGDKFLKLETDIGNTGSFTTAGTTQLMSVPYALEAKSSLGITNQRMYFNSLTTTQRNTVVFSTDSMVVATTGEYMLLLVSEGIGQTSNTTTWGDQGVSLRIYDGAAPVNSLGTELYKRVTDYGGSSSPSVYRVLGQRVTETYFFTLSAGEVLRPGITINTFGTGGTNTDVLGYSSLTLTLIRLK